MNNGIRDVAGELMALRGFSALNEPQKLALDKMADGAGSLVISANTASGKTFIAEVAAVNTIEKGMKAVYLVPLRALATEKFDYFKLLKAVVENIRVELRTGDYDSDEEGLDDADLIVATYQKFDSIVRHSPDWLNRVGLVIADEGHEITDVDSGSTIEILLTRLKGMGVNVLILSAVMPNVRDVSSWLGTEFVESRWRPVPLSVGVYCEGRVEVVHRCGREPSARLSKSCKKYGCFRHTLGHIEYADRTVHDVTAETGEPILDLVLDTVRGKGQALVFARGRKESVSLAEKLRPHLPGLLGGEERRSLEDLAERVKGIGEDHETASRLAACIAKGAAFHNAGLNSGLRRAVEDGFRARLIKVICATPTLAAGVNTPSRRVIVQSIMRYTPAGMVQIPRYEAENMFGRAGRPGYDAYGEAILIPTKWVSREEILEYLSRPVEDITSKLLIRPSFYSHVLSEICLSNGPLTEEALMNLFSRTFYAVQQGGENVQKFLKESLAFLGMYGLIRRNDIMQFEPTRLGSRISMLYISPLSYPLVRNALRHGQPNPLGYLELITSMTEWRTALPIKGLSEWRGDQGLMIDDVDDLGGRLDIGTYSPESASLLMDWIEEKKEPYKQYDIGEGDLHAMTETSRWLLFALREMARMERANPTVIREIETLRKRMKKGVKEELLDICGVRGIGRVRGRELFNRGVRTAAQYREGVGEGILPTKDKATPGKEESADGTGAT